MEFFWNGIETYVLGGHERQHRIGIGSGEKCSLLRDV
jgi:hypothetical protein